MPNVNYCPDLNEALTMMQVANGVVVEYVRSMGVDPIFLTEMSRAGPETINTLPEDKLREYRIIYEFRTESWEFQTDAQGQFFLQYLHGDQWRRDKVEIYCNRTNAPRLYLWLVHDVNRANGPIDGQKIVDLAARGITAVWQMDAQTPDGFADVRNVALQPYEIIDPPKLTERGHVATHHRPDAPLPRRALRRRALPDRHHRARRPDRPGLQPDHDEPRPRQAVGYCALLPLAWPSQVEAGGRLSPGR